MPPIDRSHPLSTDQRRFECRDCGYTDTAAYRRPVCPQCGGTVDSTLTDDDARRLPE